MASPVLGIDLGTTNSVVAVADGGRVQVLASPEGDKLFPSVVSFHPSGDVLAGYPARERRLVDAANTVYSVKRLIGRPFASEEVKRAMERLPFAFTEGPTGGALVVARGDTYTLPEISAFVLRGVRALAEDALNAQCRRAVITVPANFNELQRSATKAAGRVAGLDVLRILNEPTAAALAYGCGAAKGRERIAVYDFGGGTFDVTILELAGDVFEVVATAGDTFLGGDDMDLAIADRMVQAFLKQTRYDARRDTQAFERMRAAAEWAKCQLSTNDDVELTVEELAYGDGGAALDLRFEMPRSELESLVRPLVKRTFEVCEEAMRIGNLRPSQLDQVILVGGSTRMPLVRQMVRAYFDRDPLASIDPDLVVAQGAAIQGAMLAGQEEAFRPNLPGMAIGRVALKRMATPSVREVDERAPTGPAFQPKRAPLVPANAPAITSLGAPAITSLGAPAITPLAAPTGALPSAPTGASAEASRPASLGAAGGQSQGAAPSKVAVLQARSIQGAPAAPPPAAPPVFPPADDEDSLPELSLMEPSVATELPVARPMPPLPGATTFRGPAVSGGLVPLDEPPPLQEIHLPQGKAPLLLDVTPQSLRIETVAGFTEVIIERNAAIPVEQSRLFTTSQDFQESVRARVCQGESRRLDENQELGTVELQGLAPGPRGKARISVTFILDADGTLQVRAKDLNTGTLQSIRVSLVGGVGEDEIQRMTARQHALVG